MVNKSRRSVITTAVTISLVLSLVFGFASPVYAITYGQPDEGEHPYVCMVIAYDIDGLRDPVIASGTLVAPNVVLTAGHVTFDMEYALVSFEEELSSEGSPDLDWGKFISSAISGVPYTHPGFDPFYSSFPNNSDVGVIVLSDPVVMDTYGELPEIGMLDTLDTQRGKKEIIFTTVGYGLRGIKPFPQGAWDRYKSTQMLTNLRSHLTDGWNLQTSNNPGKGMGTGGSCYGDSGGPLLHGESSTVVAVVSFGLNQLCKGTDFAYRIDTEHAQGFINSFLAD